VHSRGRAGGRRDGSGACRPPVAGGACVWPRAPAAVARRRRMLAGWAGCSGQAVLGAAQAGFAMVRAPRKTTDPVRAGWLGRQSLAQTNHPQMQATRCQHAAKSRWQAGPQAVQVLVRAVQAQAGSFASWRRWQCPTWWQYPRGHLQRRGAGGALARAIALPPVHAGSHLPAGGEIARRWKPLRRGRSGKQGQAGRCRAK